MKTYNITLTSLVNPSRDLDLISPQTKDFNFIVNANNLEEAISIAKDQHSFGDEM